MIVDLGNGARLQVTADTRRAERAIESRMRHLERTRPLLESIALVLRRGFGEQFAAGGDPAWQPLAPSTVRAKERAGYPRRGRNGRILRRLRQAGAIGGDTILIRTGALRDAYRRKGARGHRERFDEAAGRVTVGVSTSSLPYAAAMQHGAKLRPRQTGKAKVLDSLATRRGGVPARPLRITEETRAQVRAEIAGWLAGKAPSDTGAND